MKKLFSISLMMIVALAITAGFIMEDPHGSKTTTSDSKSVVNNQVYTPYGTVVYTDDFDGANDTTALKARGYIPYYRGAGAQGSTATWFQGNATVFNAYNGPTTGYVAANYNVVTGANNIDSWLVLPRLSGGILAGDSLYFWSRSSVGSTWPDSVRVMYSTNDSVPEGSWVELGRFRTNITTGWERKGFRAPTASANGRFAIRYCVVNGGPSGSNSDYMGIDALTIERSAAPPPSGTWTEQTSGITTALYSVSAVNDDVAWIGGAAGKIIKTVNKGAAWTNAAGDLPVQDVYCIYGFDANNALATTSPSTGTFIYKTTNGGTNWTQVFSETGGFGDGFAFLNATTGFFYGDPVGARWSLWKTTNAGSTWDSTGLYVPSAGAAGWNNAMFNLGNKIWFGSNTVNLPYSGNGGATWSNQTTPAVNQYAIWFNSSSVGLSGGANLNVTTDGGTTWTALTSIGTGNVSGIVGASSSWWFSRQTTAVNFSSDNGATWAAQYTAPAGNFYHLALSRSGATIWGVRSNGGISRYGQPISGINPISNETPVNYSLSQNYPNPFNPTTKINFALPKSGLVTLKVYDVVGKEVATLVNEVKNVGTYSVDFNASNLSSGIYFYKVSVNGFSEVKKMMLVK